MPKASSVFMPCQQKSKIEELEHLSSDEDPMCDDTTACYFPENDGSDALFERNAPDRYYYF